MRCPRCNERMTESISMRSGERKHVCNKCSMEIKDEQVIHNIPNYERKIPKYKEMSLYKTIHY